MTQTPRGYDPQDPNDVPDTRYPVIADAPANPVDEGYPAGGAATSERPAGGPATSGQPAGAPAGTVPVQRGDAPHAGTAGTPASGTDSRQVTRAGMIWVAVASALVVLVLLIVFILQNQLYVQVKFFGLEGSVPLGIALFIAAVGGGVLVAIAGAARIIQLRRAAHRRRVSQGAGTR